MYQDRCLPANMPMPKPRKLQKPEDVANSGDPYSCQRTEIYFCNHKGFNAWYEEHMSKFFGESTVARKPKKKSIDIESSVKDIIAAAAAPKQKPKRRNDAGAGNKNAARTREQRQTSRSKTPTNQRQRSKSPTKTQGSHRSVSSAPTSRATKVDPLHQTYPSRRSNSAEFQNNGRAAQAQPSSKNQRPPTKEFLPAMMTGNVADPPPPPSHQTGETSSAKASHGKLFSPVENAMTTLKNFILQCGHDADDNYDLIDAVGTRDVTAAIGMLTNKSSTPEVAVRLAQHGMVKTLIKLLMLEDCAPWATHTLLCLNNLSAFLLRSATARLKYLNPQIMAALLSTVGKNVQAILLQAAERNIHSVGKAAMQLMGTIVQASEDDPEMSKTFVRHGGLHMLLLISHHEDLKEAAKMARIMLGRFGDKALRSLPSIYEEHPAMSALFFENLEKELEKREEFKNRHQHSLKQQRDEKLKAHVLVEERRIKTQEFLQAQDEKAKALRAKISKRMESVMEKQQKEEEFERARLEALAVEKRNSLVEKRKEIDRMQQEKEEQEKDAKRRQAREKFRVEMEKERRNEEKVKEWLEHKRSEKKKKHQEELHLQQREHEENLKALQAMRKQMDDVLARAKNRSPRQRRGATSDENTSANRGKSKRKPRKNSPYAEVFGLNADGTTISIDHSQTNRIKMVGVIKSPPRIKRDTSFPPLGSSLDTSIGTSTESFDPSTVTPSPPSPIRVKPPSPSRYMLKK